MSNIYKLLDELREMIDDERFRVNDLFERIRASVPRPMTLVYTEDDTGVFHCSAGGMRYALQVSDRKWQGRCNGTIVRCGEFSEVVAAMQSHFNAAWSAMTAKGAAT